MQIYLEDLEDLEDLEVINKDMDQTHLQPVITGNRDTGMVDREEAIMVDTMDLVVDTVVITVVDTMIKMFIQKHLLMLHIPLIMVVLIKKPPIKQKVLLVEV